MTAMDPNPAEDMFEDVRGMFRDLSMGFFAVATLTMGFYIVISILFVMILDFYCVDYDDFIAFHNIKVDGIFRAILVINFILVSEALAFGIVVLLSNLAAVLYFSVIGHPDHHLCWFSCTILDLFF